MLKPTFFSPAIATTVTTVCLVIPALAAASWRPFSAPNSGFRVLFPGTPVQNSQVLNTSVGKIPLRVYAARDNNAGYIVGHGTLPANSIKNAQEEQLALNSVPSGLAQFLEGSVVSSGNLTLQGNRGKSFKLKLRSGEMMPVRVFIVNRRDLYYLFVITNQEQNLQKSIQGFFNSFQFINNSTVARGNNTSPANRPKPKPPRNLNNELQQAVCQQNWSQAVRVVDDMRKVVRNPRQQQELVSYRQTLVRLSQSRSSIPQNLLTGCTPRPAAQT